MSQFGTTAWQQFEELQQRAHTLSAALQEAAADLRTEGWEPVRELDQQLAAFQSEYVELRCSLWPNRRDDAGFSAPGWQDFEAALQVNDLRDQALYLLADIQKLHHQQVDLDSLLEPVRAQCRDLQDRLQQEPSPLPMEALLAGAHPVAAVWKLVTEGEQLTDQHWTELHQTIAAAFGRDLATAIARGRIRPAHES